MSEHVKVTETTIPDGRITISITVTGNYLTHVVNLATRLNEHDTLSMSVLLNKD